MGTSHTLGSIDAVGGFSVSGVPLQSPANRPVTASIAVAAGASNVATFTITLKDGLGAAITGIHEIELWTASNAAGDAISTTAYSGALAATTGKILTQITSKHHALVLTDANGVFVGTITDTAKTADYIAIRRPNGQSILVGADALAYG